MTCEQMTPHKKTLLIAKHMYGKENVQVRQDRHEPDVLVLIHDHVGFQGFDPYNHAYSSQSVQEFFMIDTTYFSGDWVAIGRIKTGIDILESNEVSSKTLRGAIADCAAGIVLQKKLMDFE